MVSGSSPILVAADVPETIRFYTEVLGFTSSWTYGEPPTYGGVNWGKGLIMFIHMPDLVGRVEGHQHWIDVEEVDALHTLHLERGAMIVSPIEDKPWGKREYTVRDPNGYHLRFAGIPSHESQIPEPMPEGVQIVRRMPTPEEHGKIPAGVFYKGEVPFGALERGWNGVVALDASGQAIGTVRINYDAPGWYSIWDVAVLPEWQGKRIGTAMMEEALQMVREESPGAFVYLFTYRPSFYERIGFETGSLHIRRV